MATGGRPPSACPDRSAGPRTTWTTRDPSTVVLPSPPLGVIRAPNWSSPSRTDRIGRCPGARGRGARATRSRTHAQCACTPDGGIPGGPTGGNVPTLRHVTLPSKRQRVVRLPRSNAPAGRFLILDQAVVAVAVLQEELGVPLRVLDVRVPCPARTRLSEIPFPETTGQGSSAPCLPHVPHEAASMLSGKEGLVGVDDRTRCFHQILQDGPDRILQLRIRDDLDQA